MNAAEGWKAMARVSIIIAAYNVEAYIREALDSAAGQTMRDIEIVCVDDGSTDGTAALLAEYAAKDSRVRVIRHEKNQGPFAARHTGLMAATGEYVLFLDGDDRYVPHACARLYEKAVSEKLDVVDCGASLLVSEGCFLDGETLAERAALYAHAPKRIPKNRAELLQTTFVEKDIRWAVWGKMYALGLMKKAYAPFNGERIVMAEDALTIFMAFFHARSYGYLDECLYCYRWGSGISTSEMPPTVQKLETIATEYRAPELLCKWLTPAQRREKGVEEALGGLRQKIQDEIFHYFMRGAIPEDCPAFLKIILQYRTLEEFVLDLAEAASRDRFIQMQEIALRLRDCEELFPKPGTIRTVASFYYRLTNGGVERVIALLASIWQSAGCRVVVVTEQAPTAQDYPLPEGVERVVLPAGEDGRARAMAWQQIIRKYQIDAVVYHAWLSGHRVMDALAIKSQQIPFILHTHNVASVSLQDPCITNLHQEAKEALSDVIVALSETDEAWWQALGYRSICTWNPLTYRPGDVQPSALRGHDVLWVARLSSEKRYEDAFEIAMLVHQKIPDFRLHVVGTAESDSEFERIQKRLADHGMDPYIILHGFQTDMERFYQNACAILLTSEVEGAPMVVMESKAFGLPLVTYELANVSAIRREEGMFVVPQRDRHAAADRLIRLLQDEALRRRMGDEARRSAQEIADADLGAHWNRIFELAMIPREPHQPLYRQPPLTASLCMTMRKVGADEARAADYRKLLRENTQYATMVQEIQTSTAYRLGRALTAFPRWLKSLLRRG